MSLRRGSLRAICSPGEQPNPGWGDMGVGLMGLKLCIFNLLESRRPRDYTLGHVKTRSVVYSSQIKTLE